MPGTGKMKHVSLTLQVENDLKHQLSIGALKPGARLITKNLAEQLGMSITPVREALLRLVSVNALSVAPAQAFTVPEVGKRQLDEINRIRYELELMAVALAVKPHPARPCGTPGIAREITAGARKGRHGTNH